jgi:hypothetical protein
MSRPFVAVVASLMALSACRPPVGAISVGAIFPFLPDETDPVCDLEESDFRVLAFPIVDVAASDPDVRVLVRLEGQDLFTSATSQPPLTSGTRTLAPAGRDTARIEKVELRYASKPAIPGIVTGGARETVDTIALVAPATEDVLMPVPLFGREMVRRLNELGPDNEASYDVTVTFEVHGSMVLSGSTFRTSPTPFSVRVVKSQVTCPGSDQRLARFEPAVVPALQACSYFGVGRRFTDQQCCSNAANSGRPGCEPMP